MANATYGILQNRVKSPIQSRTQTQIPVVQESTNEKKSKELEWWNPLSWASTVGDLAGDIVVGAGKSIEGIADFALGVVGSAASLFGSDKLEDALSNAIKYDVTGNTLGKIDNAIGSKSLISGDNFISNTLHDVAGGVGGMLPAIFTGPASMAVFGLGAAGRATEEALNDGASIGKATLYGAGSGLLETAVERFIGPNMIDKKVVGNIAKKGIAGVAKAYIGEGLEEVVSDLADPFLKRVTYKDSIEMPSLSELFHSFNVGGLTAVAMGGGAKAINLSQYGVKGEKAVNLYNEAKEINAEMYEMEKRGELTPEVREEYLNKRNDLLAQVGNTMSEITNKNKKARVEEVVAEDIKQTQEFDEKKQAVYETIEKSNKEYNTDIKVEFVNNDVMKQRYNEINDGKSKIKKKSVINGYFDSNTNTIVINENSTNPYSVVAAQNLVRSKENTQLYNEISSDILSSMSQEEIDIKHKELRKIYGKKADIDQLNKEVVANYIGEMFAGDSKSLLDIATKKPNVINRIINWVDTKISNSSENSVESKELTKLRNKVQQMLTSKSDINKQSTNINTNVNNSKQVNNAESDLNNIESNSNTNEQSEEKTKIVSENDDNKEIKEEIKEEVKEEVKEDETVDQSKKSEIATQEDIEELNEKELDEKLSKQVKTKLMEEDVSFIENIKGLTEKGKQALTDAFHNREMLKSKMQILLTNSFAGVENQLKQKIEEEGKKNKWTKEKIKEEVTKQVTEVKMAYNKAYRSISSAEYMIGKDLKGIWKKINKKGFEYTNEFELFLLHRLNTIRMKVTDDYKQLEALYKSGQINKERYDMIEEELKHYKTRPVFNENVDAEYSRKKIKELESKHPEFVEYAGEVYKYLEGLMHIRKASGIVSEEQIKFMNDTYVDKESGVSWYVPTQRDTLQTKNRFKKNNNVTGYIYKAKGSDLDIQSIMLSMAEQTVGVHKQSAINHLFNVVHNKMPEYFVKTNESKQTRDDMDGNIEVKSDEDKRKNKYTTVYFYENGNKSEYNCPEFIGAAFESIRNQQNDLEELLDKTTGKLVSILKKVTTEWNPFFAVRNFFRDASDAFIYTKYNINLIGRYAKTFNEIRKGDKSDYYELYMRNGGQNFSFFDRESGIKDKKQFFLLEKITSLNETIELLPRLSEFMESLKAQGYKNVNSENVIEIPQQAIDKAMLDASEVTVNFARGGTFAKKMNRYLMPYLNASIQGWCKTWNTFVHPASMKAWGMSMAKIVMMALPTLLLNEMLLGDDEEYEQLSDEIKGSYILIKTGNNKFIRIPRGRVEAIVGDAMQRTYRTIKGEEDAFDGYASNTLKNVSPVDNITRTILSPITDVTTNTTWYGGSIENSSMQKLPVNERYDYNTSAIAKILNKLVPSVSPKKWHYLLDQYSGILGDIVLPLTSKNKDLSRLTGLTTNSLDNNKYTNKFYNTLTELEEAKNSEKGTAVDKAKMRYFNKMNSKISKLYKESKNTTDEETRIATQELIVQLQKQTLENLDKFSQTLNKYAYGLSIDELYDDYYLEATRECFGAETALLDYDSRIYEKAVKFNKAGVDWDTFYCAYFDAQDISADYDKDGNAITGSRKEKVTKYVKSLKITATQKYMIMGLLGYKNANGETQVRSYLVRNGFKGQELKEMLELCGY